MVKKFVSALAIAALLAVSMLYAQTPVQESSQMVAGPKYSQNYSTAGGTGTLTINSGGGCVYIWEVDASPVNGTNTTVTNGFVTLTAGAVVRKWAVGVGATAQAMGTGFTYAPAKPFKTTATSITLTTPTGLANATWVINIDYDFGSC